MDCCKMDGRWLKWGRLEISEMVININVWFLPTVERKGRHRKQLWV